LAAIRAALSERAGALGYSLSATADLPSIGDGAIAQVAGGRISAGARALAIASRSVALLELKLAS
jgi:hypothetical protein